MTTKKSCERIGLGLTLTHLSRSPIEKSEDAGTGGNERDTRRAVKINLEFAKVFTSMKRMILSLRRENPLELHCFI